MIAAAAPPLPVDLVESLRRLRLATMREQAADLHTARTQRWAAEDVRVGLGRSVAQKVIERAQGDDLQ